MTYEGITGLFIGLAAIGEGLAFIFNDLALAIIMFFMLGVAGVGWYLSPLLVTFEHIMKGDRGQSSSPPSSSSSERIGSPQGSDGAPNSR